jgi:predicted Zn-dependent protease
MTGTGPAEPLGFEGCARLADAAFDAADGAELEVVVGRVAEGLTRFAGSQIHQNVWREIVSVALRAVTDDGRTGVVRVHTDDPADVARASREAVALARVAPPDPQFPGLAPSAGVATVDVDAATVAATPDDRAAAVRALVAQVPAGFDAAGAYRTAGREMAVYTTAGQRVYAPLSAAGLTVVVTGPSSSGYAEAGGRATADIDPAATGAAAVRKAEAGADPTGLDAGVWPVVLEPPAVATLVQFLAYLGFGGRGWLEGRAFTTGRLGERVVDDRVNVVDDAVAGSAVGQPFDDEGTPKRHVELIRAGVAANVVHDRHTAAQAGTVSSGHALPAPNTFGPLATDPVLLPGDGGSIADVVAGCERGVLVTRFHYTNVVNPKETVVTGMTRDGTFLIEDGQVVRPVRNLRFTQSILAALGAVDAISTETRYATELFGEGARFPALRLPAFTFSGTTSFG